MKVKHFKKNEVGKDYVVGDIHGCFQLLEARLKDTGFDEKKDRLFSVGDLVDRGSESYLSLEWLKKPWFHAVRGNHEQMAIDASKGFFDYWNYVSNGGKWFLDLTKEEQQEYARLFSKLPLAIEIETDKGLVGVVHAEVPCKKWVDIHIVPKQSVMWNRMRIQNNDTSIIEGVYKVFVGHTPIKEPLILGNTHYIDTGAFYTNNLTILPIDN